MTQPRRGPGTLRQVPRVAAPGRSIDLGGTELRGDGKTGEISQFSAMDGHHFPRLKKS